MNTIAVLDGQEIAEIQTCQSRVLENDIENLLLELATIDAVILQCQSDQTLIVYNAME